MSTEPNSPQPHPPSLGRSVFRGVIWAGAVTGLGKFASLGSQVALGWLLTDRDFGVFAAAMSFAAFASVMKDGGCSKILIQRGDEYQQIARPTTYIAWFFNCLGAAVILLASPVVARAIDEPQIAPLLWILALSLAVSTTSVAGRAKMVFEMRFRELAWINSVSLLVRHGGMVALAFTGLGPLSFVIPILAVSCYEWWAYRVQAGPLPRREVSTPFSRGFAFSMLGQSKWILISAVATTTIMQGDYLILGLVAGPVLLGTYYFGYQLTTSISTLFTSGMQQAIMPGFVRLNHDPERQNDAFFLSLRLLALTATPICLVTSLIAPLLITWIWQDRWVEAIPVAQVMALALTTRLASPISRSLIEAKGRWKTSAIAFSLDGLMMLVVTALSAYLSGLSLLAITISVGAYRMLSGIAHVVVASCVLRAPIKRVFNSYVPILIQFVFAAIAVSSTYMIWRDTPWSSIGSVIFTASLLLVMITLTFSIFFRADLRQMKSLISRKI